MSKKNSYTFRKFINDAHLWLGIGSGLILFLVCLTGTILTFEEEIKDLFHEDIEVVNTKENPLPIEKLLYALQNEGTVNSITIPYEKNEPYRLSVQTSKEERRGSTFFMNPYTGEYLKEQKSGADDFLRTMFRVHRWLLLDSKIGRPIVGVATLIFLFMAISGIILWFPKKIRWKNLKSGFKIKFSANWKRINYDLHNTLGFYACILLVIMTLTGLCWSFEWYRDAGSSVLGAKIFGNRGRGAAVESVANAETKSLSISGIYGIASKELDYEGATTISLPRNNSGIYSISKTKAAAFSPVISDKLMLDRDGSLLQKELFRDKPLNVQIASLIKPIHTGQIYGLFSKIMYFFACLIATSLPVTGTIIWLNKLKKKRKSKGSPSLVH